MSPAGRQSGEYPVPVTQEQFNGFVSQFNTHATRVEEWMANVNRQLSDGAATMAVLRADSETYKRRGDEASSKINLLIQKDKVREALESRRDAAGGPAATAAPKPTVWERFKDDLVTNIIKLIALGILIVGYHEVALFMIAHPSLTPDGEGFSAPKHERGREPIQPIPASTPSSIPKPP